MLTSRQNHAWKEACLLPQAIHAAQVQRQRLGETLCRSCAPGGVQDVEELLGIDLLGGREDNHLEELSTALQEGLQVGPPPHMDPVLPAIE